VQRQHAFHQAQELTKYRGSMKTTEGAESSLSAPLSIRGYPDNLVLRHSDFDR
jgi:hypothetical protein